MEKQTVPHESTAHKLSFKWSHTRVSSTDVKVRNTIIDLMLASGSKRVNTCTHHGSSDSLIGDGFWLLSGRKSKNSLILEKQDTF